MQQGEEVATEGAGDFWMLVVLERISWGGMYWNIRNVRYGRQGYEGNLKVRIDRMPV